MTPAGESARADVIDEFRRRLHEARQRLLRTVATTDEELATLEAHQAGGPIEDAVREVVSDLLSRLEGRQKHELDEIAAARARLEAGVFGACEGCVRPIPLARLRAMLTARYCVACQSREDAR